VLAGELKLRTRHADWSIAQITRHRLHFDPAYRVLVISLEEIKSGVMGRSAPEPGFAGENTETLGGSCESYFPPWGLWDPRWRCGSQRPSRADDWLITA
jgi:hypothetical protein